MNQRIMKVFSIGIIVFGMAGCGSLMLTGSMTEAYAQYEEQNYEKTLELITQARSVNRMTPEQNAELTFLKANTLRKLGQEEEANALYSFLAERRQDSLFGYLAARALSGKNDQPKEI